MSREGLKSSGPPGDLSGRKARPFHVQKLDCENPFTLAIYRVSSGGDERRPMLIGYPRVSVADQTTNRIDMGRSFLQGMAALAEMEGNVLRERTDAALATHRGWPEHWSHPSWGPGSTSSRPPSGARKAWTGESLRGVVRGPARSIQYRSIARDSARRVA
jgi:hypothetical protein